MTGSMDSLHICIELGCAEELEADHFLYSTSKVTTFVHALFDGTTYNKPLSLSTTSSDPDYFFIVIESVHIRLLFSNYEAVLASSLIS